MRHAPRTSPPRHLAGAPRVDRDQQNRLVEFDVEAALDAEVDFDFDALFAGGDPLEGAPKARVKAARHRIAFAVSITLAALPLLAFDNLGARADSPGTATVEAGGHGSEGSALRSSTTRSVRVATSEAVPAVVDVTVAEATVFADEPDTARPDPAPSTTVAVRRAAPAPTTTAKPAPTTTTTARPTTTTAPASPPAATARSGPDPSSDATWEQLAQCESGGNWSAVSKPRQGQVYYGGLQFSRATWESLGGTGLPSDAPKATQIAMGKKLHASSGWRAWPGCSRKLGWS